MKLTSIPYLFTVTMFNLLGTIVKQYSSLMNFLTKVSFQLVIFISYYFKFLEKKNVIFNCGSHPSMTALWCLGTSHWEILNKYDLLLLYRVSGDQTLFIEHDSQFCLQILHTPCVNLWILLGLPLGRWLMSNFNLYTEVIGWVLPE